MNQTKVVLWFSQLWLHLVIHVHNVAAREKVKKKVYIC